MWPGVAGFTNLNGLLVRGVADVVVTSPEAMSLIEWENMPWLCATEESPVGQVAQSFVEAAQFRALQRGEKGGEGQGLSDGTG